MLGILSWRKVDCCGGRLKLVVQFAKSLSHLIDNRLFLRLITIWERFSNSLRLNNSVDDTARIGLLEWLYSRWMKVIDLGWWPWELDPINVSILVWLFHFTLSEWYRLLWLFSLYLLRHWAGNLTLFHLNLRLWLFYYWVGLHLYRFLKGRLPIRNLDFLLSSTIRLAFFPLNRLLLNKHGRSSDIDWRCVVCVDMSLKIRSVYFILAGWRWPWLDYEIDGVGKIASFAAVLREILLTI